MTSSKPPAKQPTKPSASPRRVDSVRDRISSRLSTDARGRHLDAEAQHTRNVIWMFYGIIVVVVVIIGGGLIYGFWEANLKPVARVGGTDVSRGQVEDRRKLEEFRYERTNSQTTNALAEGTIGSDLANFRFGIAENERPTSDAQILTDLVDLLYKERLAGEEDVTLGEGELQAAVEADGSFAEVREVDALIFLTDEQAQGQASTDAGIADARERALAAAAELEAGADPEQLAQDHGPANYETAWVTHDDLGIESWADDIFSAEVGEVTPPAQADTGEQLVAKVLDIGPEQADAGFVEAVNGAVGEETHRRNVELEALAAKLEQTIVDEALATEYDQVELAEIFLERSPRSTDDSAGEARVSHILYQPETPLDEEGNPTALADLPADDPAWDAARAQAQAAFDDLSSIDDIRLRTAAFAERAKVQSDDGSAALGGDLGWFPREAMVSEFSDAVWSNVDPEHGDVLGPVRTQLGWHVILFDAFRSSLDVRVSDVQKALAEEGADFAQVAAELSDGPEAADGGKIGWQVSDLLDDETFLALSAIEVGGTSDPVDSGDGYRIYQKLDEATRPLAAEDAARVEQTAFADWYDDRYLTAQKDGIISIDDAVYEQ